MCVCGGGEVEGRAARRCGRQRHLDAQRWAPAPAQSIGSLSPPPRLGCRQVHFRATGQIDSSAFIFFRLRSGSCLETGGRSTENGERQTQERGREGRSRSAMKEGRRREKEELLALFLVHVFSCSSLFSLSLPLSLGNTANTPPPHCKSLSRRALTTPPPSPKLEISPRTSL